MKLNECKKTRPVLNCTPYTTGMWKFLVLSTSVLCDDGSFLRQCGFQWFDMLSIATFAMQRYKELIHPIKTANYVYYDNFPISW